MSSWLFEAYWPAEDDFLDILACNEDDFFRHIGMQGRYFLGILASNEDDFLDILACNEDDFFRHWHAMNIFFRHIGKQVR